MQCDIFSGAASGLGLQPVARPEYPAFMDRDTHIGGEQSGFPETQRSAVRATRDDDPQRRQRGWEAIIAAYWKPIYKYIRLKVQLPNEQAKDLTQGFFARAMEGGYFDDYDPRRASFRTFLRTCLDGFIAKEHRAATAQKRGGGAVIHSLDFESAEAELKQHRAPAGKPMDEYFHAEWVRSLFALAIARLEQRCRAADKPIAFELFRRYDLCDREAGPRATYEQLARELAIPGTQVTNHLVFARRELRQIVLDLLREMTGNEDEFRAEARALLGSDPL